MLMPSVVVWVEPAREAEIDADKLLDTTDVAITKDDVVEPAGTTTDDGTTACAELLDSETVQPPMGAGAERVTVPMVKLPPTTVFGLIFTEPRCGARIDNLSEIPTPLA